MVHVLRWQWPIEPARRETECSVQIALHFNNIDGSCRSEVNPAETILLVRFSPKTPHSADLREVLDMQEQRWLPGVNSSPKPSAIINPTDSLFFAVLPEVSAAVRIRQLAQSLRLKHALRGSPLPAGQLHISLFSLGNHVGLPSGLPAATEAVSQLAQNAFTVQFNNVLTFRYKSRLSGGYPIVLCGDEGVIGLELLHQGLMDALSRTEFKGTRKNLTPHVTLLYDDRKIPADRVAPIEWSVREFVLLRRHIGQNRPYSVLGRWPLCGK